MTRKLEVIDNSQKVKCWTCEGKDKTCQTCDGSGIWREPSYILIAETPNGEKIAFQSDFIK